MNTNNVKIATKKELEAYLDDFKSTRDRNYVYTAVVQELTRRRARPHVWRSVMEDECRCSTCWDLAVQLKRIPFNLKGSIKYHD